jgi:hypothetical protein
VTIDEELALLSEQLRRLKIEYEIFFNNPAKRPPTDIEWKVLSLIRKFSDGARLSFSQRFKYNEMAQRYAVQSDLWRKKMRIREEGYRRPYEAMLSVQGVRGAASEERAVKHHPVYGLSRNDKDNDQNADAGSPSGDQAFSVQCSGTLSERSEVETLFKALSEAKQKSGEAVSGNLASFATFVRKKTTEIRNEYGCDAVVYSIEIQNGQVKLKAKAKT